MIHKTYTISSTAFVLIALMLVLFAPNSLASRQGEGRASESQSTDGARQADEFFRSALLLYDAQERASARLRLQEAMRLWVQLREPGKAANAAMQMGDHSKQSRKYEDAVHYYQQALGVKLIPDLVKTNALNALAQIYAELYQADLAMHYFEKARDQARLINDPAAETLALSGLANLYYERGEKKQALALIARAQLLNRQRSADVEAGLLCLFAQIRGEEGRVKDAQNAFEAALSIYVREGHVDGQVRVLCSMSSLAGLNKQAAIEYAQRAVDLANKQAKNSATLADRASARELQWFAWLARARAERALGQNDLAYVSYKAARSHFEGLWWSRYIVTESSAIGVREKSQATYREYLDLKIEKGKLEEAYELADEGKARTILNFAQSRRQTPPSSGPNRKANFDKLSQSIVALRLELLASESNPEKREKLKKEVAEAELNLQELQLQEEMAHSTDRLVWSKLANAKQLLEETKQDQKSLVEFSLGESRSFVWLFTRGDLHFKILPARKEIEEAVRSYLNRITAPPNHLNIKKDIANSRKQAGELFTTLFGSLGRHIEPGQRLIVVPDGLLHYLPFESLIRDNRYLIEDHEISYSPSASLLHLWRDSVSRVDEGDRMELLAIGDPIFEPESKAASKESKTGSYAVTRQALARRGFRLAPLPRTKDEVEYIAGLFPPDKQKMFLGSESTEEALKREPLARYKRLHFATHSLIEENTPARSSIVLSLGDKRQEDGLLEVREISRLELDCDLVVVSACQTGRGQLLSGEGIVGLSRAFIHAGARSVVVSLWNVSDISTSQLMKGFYRHMAGGLGNAAALREAKLQMIGLGKQTEHPYYWASFVLVGKP